MIKPKITLSNVFKFVSGYSRLYYDKFVGLPKHEQEQIAYRIELCKDDCGRRGYCTMCGCDYPAKLFVPESCNPERFPDLMPGKEWEQFKKDNNISG